MAALGVVFGDIGTSPLYTLKTCFTSAHAGVSPGKRAGDPLADRLGLGDRRLREVRRRSSCGSTTTARAASWPCWRCCSLAPERGIPPKATWFVVVVVVGAAMLFGDGVITPAISVISAVEGIGVATTAAQPWIVPISLLLDHRAVRDPGARHGEGRRRCSGPAMLAWFLAIAAAGIVGHRAASGGPVGDRPAARLRVRDPARAGRVLRARRRGAGRHRRRGALRRPLALRAQADRARLVRPRLARGDVVRISAKARAC